MSFVENLVLFAAVKGFCKSTRTDKVIAMVRGTLLLTHSVVLK